MVIGQLTRDEGVAPNAKVPNDRLISREGLCIPQYRHRMSTGADTCTRSDSRGTYSIDRSIKLNTHREAWSYRPSSMEYETEIQGV